MASTKRAQRRGAPIAPAEVRRRWAQRLPARGLPIAYFAFAHLCLGAAFGVIMADPWSIAGFFYHPRLLAVVHLVTLGWLTCSILGGLYIVAPLALATRLLARRTDHWGCALVIGGVCGMVSHFWIDEASGLAWSGGLLITGFALPMSRFLRALAAARLPREIKTPFFLAFLNFLVAGTTGLLIALDKVFHFLPGHIHDRVFAHAHLAAIGWAMMMVTAVGYRLLPMLLPAAMPHGGWLWAATLSLELGALGLFVSLLRGGSSAPAFAALTVVGFGIFLSSVVWMLRHRRRPAKARPRHDLGLWQVAQALLYAVASVALGLSLAIPPLAAWKLPAVMVYGVIALLGFLGQLIVAISPRLFSILAWLWATAEHSFRTPMASPYEMPSRVLQGAVLILWTLGIPALASGLALGHILLLRTAAAGLLLAVLLQTANLAQILQHAVPQEKRSARA